MERRAFCRACVCTAVWAFVLGRSPQPLAQDLEPWLAVAIQRQPVRSTNLASVGYNARIQVLEVEFKSGSVYRYREVPPQVHGALLRADSKGAYFTQRIRSRFPFRRMENSGQ